MARLSFLRRFDAFKEIKKLTECSKLMVVAHPDDETFWGGATLAREEGWGVLCLTHRESRARRRAFESSMELLGAQGVILDMPDRKEHPPAAEDLAWLQEILSGVLSSGRISIVLTHGPDGEYGHPFHKAISSTMTQLVPNPIPLWFFNFSDQVNLERDSPTDFEKKQRAIREYLGPENTWHDSDTRHVRLGVHENPVARHDYVRPTELLRTIYSGSEITI